MSAWAMAEARSRVSALSVGREGDQREESREQDVAGDDENEDGHGCGGHRVIEGPVRPLSSSCN